MVAENRFQHFERRDNVGGRSYAPSTHRLRPACISAYTAAYVKTLRRPGSVFSDPPQRPGHFVFEPREMPIFGGQHGCEISG